MLPAVASTPTLESAASMIRRLNAREITAEQLVRAHIDHISIVNPVVNAVVQVANNRALSEAAETDASWVENGPSLRGLPFTVKDNFETAGIPTAVGVPERRGLVPEGDAALIGHMRELGAILVGKTNCPPWGAGIVTDNEVYGRTNNPYDPACTPGGSSGGEAAAVAAGMSPMGLGTDSGGSVRLPAHFCGVAAILPTARVLPLSGVIDDDGMVGEVSDPRTRVGIMARRFDDLSTILHHMLPLRTRGEANAPFVLPPHSEETVRGLRVALSVGNEIVPPDDVTAAVVRHAGVALERASALVDEIRLPQGGWEITRGVWRSYRGQMRSAELYGLLRRWDGFRRDWNSFFQRYDLMLSPVFPSAAPRHGEIDEAGVSYTAPASLTESPSGTVRCGSSPEGLPIGVQLVAAPWNDYLVLAAATVLEQELGGWAPPPNLQEGRDQDRRGDSPSNE